MGAWGGVRFRTKSIRGGIRDGIRMGVRFCTKPNTTTRGVKMHDIFLIVLGFVLGIGLGMARGMQIQYNVYASVVRQYRQALRGVIGEG